MSTRNSVEAYRVYLLEHMRSIEPARDDPTWHIWNQVRQRIQRWHVKRHWLDPEARFDVTRSNGEVTTACTLQDVETILREDPGATYYVT